jgi:serine/threonine-protein kinase
MNTVAMQPKKEQAVQKNYILVGPEGQRVELTQASMVIGLSHPSDPSVPDIDLQALGMLEARTASRRHCRIFRDGGVYYVEDMGSMNGSRLNGQTMEANTPYEIHEGDVLQTGRVDLTFTSV